MSAASAGISFFNQPFISLPFWRCDYCRVNSMSFAGKNLTQGGQMTAYRWRMFFQVNNWIGFWIFILFAVLAAVIFFLRIPQEVFDNGSLWWFSSINSSFINLMPPGTPKLYDIHYWYAATQTQMVLKMTLPQILTDPYMTAKEINGNHVHRPGHDLTFSAPKSVSILALIGGDKEMLEAHNHAVRIAAGYVEKLISARDTKDGITSIVHTGKMVAAAFTHDTSRNLDPQLHTHLLVANMTEQDGKWKALATDYIHNAGFIETVMKMQVTLGKIYRSALRSRVEALGHEVEEVGKHGMWEIKGVPEEVREDLSSRGREIQGAIGAEATLRSRDVAAKDTRRAKVDPSRLRLMERWLGQLKEKGFDLRAYQDSIQPSEYTGQEKLPEAGSVLRNTPVTPGLTTSTTPEQDQGKVSGEKQAPAQPRDRGIHLTTNGRFEEPLPIPEVTEAVRQAISQLSDNKTRFTFGELMLTTAELSEKLPDMKDIRVAIDASLKDGMIVPLDSEKGVFTSRIHLLDELSIQALSQEHIKSTSVVSFTRPEQYAPPSLAVVEQDPLVLMNAPSGVAGIRDLTTQLTGISTALGRDVQVLASSAERAISLAKSDTLRDRLISRQHVLSGDFHLKPQSTLIIEGAERLGLKETLVLLGEARAQDAQLVFLDSAGRQANGNAMSVLESAGISRSRRTEPAPGLESVHHPCHTRTEVSG